MFCVASPANSQAGLFDLEKLYTRKTTSVTLIADNYNKNDK